MPSHADIEFGELLAECQDAAMTLTRSLPRSVSVAAVGTLKKAPHNILCFREALIWRTEELARNACEALARQDVVAAALLTRAVAESTAIIWMLRDVLKRRRETPDARLNERVMKLLLGSKDNEELPPPFHIMDCLRLLERDVPDAMRSYESLSEYAHPNWKGVLGLFSRTDHENFETHFGRYRLDPARREVANSLPIFISLFELAYNEIADEIFIYISELPSLWQDHPSG